MAERGIILPAAVLAVAIIGGGAVYWFTRGEPEREMSPLEAARAAARACPVEDQVQYRGKIFCPGTRVEVYKYAGHATPDESGYPEALLVQEGISATVVGPVLSKVSGEPAVALLAFDEQDWQTESGATAVNVPAFRSTTHADYLRLPR